jgi:hypothetical protein
VFRRLTFLARGPLVDDDEEAWFGGRWWRTLKTWIFPAQEYDAADFAQKQANATHGSAVDVDGKILATRQVPSSDLSTPTSEISDPLKYH